MGKKKNRNIVSQRDFIFVVTCEGEYDKCFAYETGAMRYCNEQDDIYDTGSWHIIKVPIKDLQSPIY